MFKSWKKCNISILKGFKQVKNDNKKCVMPCIEAIDAAKEYVNQYTNKALTSEIIEKQLDFYKKMMMEAHNNESKKGWQDEIDKLLNWKNSENFKLGNYAQGIDELILELIEWRASIYAFQNVRTIRDPFKESGFIAQWYLGAVYGIFVIIGKLISCDSRDISLRKLWAAVSPTMFSDGACLKEEMQFITEQFDYDKEIFTNEKSQTMLFRNKLIAHNEAYPVIAWTDVDKEISLLIRVWSLLVSWSSFGIVEPFRSSEQAFLGIETFFSLTEIEELKVERGLFLQKVREWSSCFAHTKEQDAGRDAFTKISVEVIKV